MSTRVSGSRSVDAYTHELAISAVPYDSMLVAELSDRLAVRLGPALYWAGSPAEGAPAMESPIVTNTARLVLVLHQRLWGHDRATHADAAALRERVGRRPRSARLVILDAEPVPEWLTAMPSCALDSIGLEGVTDFALAAIAGRGGSLRPIPAPPPEAPQSSRWFETPADFLTQHRAISSLRHELDALAAELKPRVRREAERMPDRVAAVHSEPDRLVVQLGSVGLSFSWVAGGPGTVAQGRLLVIEWAGLTPRGRGVATLHAATPVRECVYRPEAAGPQSWKWRADDPNGRAFSTVNLAGEWLASASIAASG